MSNEEETVPVPVPAYIFVLASKTVVRLGLVHKDGESVKYITPDNVSYDSADVVQISAEERLILTPARELSDEELQEALSVLNKTRLESSDRPKSRSREKQYQDETGLRLSKSGLAAKLRSMLDSEEPSNET